jgi:Family of unknown function (DUF6804)
MNKYINIIKIILSVLLFLCLLKMPYGYYQLVRFIAAVVFVFLSYQSYQKKDNGYSYIFAVLAILFQPFIKISLGRGIWNTIDVIVGIGLFVTIFWKRTRII